MRDLEILIRQHGWELDIKRRKVAELEQMRSDLTRRMDSINQQIEAEKDVSGVEDGAYAFSNYLTASRRLQENLMTSLDEVDRCIDEAQEEVREEFIELKKYEMAKERLEERQQVVKRRRENIAMDEVAANMHRRAAT